ncbi:hypothetical protein Mapa_002845 [Marchantia paleacea]|nr:hypothetical protein Mapa_002845 [Marchantia paleacea]
MEWKVYVWGMRRELLPVFLITCTAICEAAKVIIYPMYESELVVLVRVSDARIRVQFFSSRSSSSQRITQLSLSLSKSYQCPRQCLPSTSPLTRNVHTCPFQPRRGQGSTP